MDMYACWRSLNILIQDVDVFQHAHGVLWLDRVAFKGLHLASTFRGTRHWAHNKLNSIQELS